MKYNQFTKTPINRTLFTIIDVETTGLNPVNNRITEIGIVKLINGNIISEYSRLINPGQFISPEITRLTGISNELVYGKPCFSDIADEVSREISRGNNNLLCGHNVRFDYLFLNHSLHRYGYKKISLPTLCTARLARRIHNDLKSRSLDSLKKHYGIFSSRRHRALDDAKLTAEILMHLLDKLIDEYGIETTGDILTYQYKRIFNEVNSSVKINRIKNYIKNAPQSPGVYFMYNRKKEIIYIGKTKNLRERLSSYFSHNSCLPTKVRKLLRSVSSIKWEVKFSELSALINESKLIKKYKPRFNSAIKRYRQYPFIKIDVNNPYPRIYKVYEIIPDGGLYFGPFSCSATVEYLIGIINKKFRVRKCRDRHLKPSKQRTPCMYFEISQCQAPCNYNISKKEYRHEINKICEFLISDDSSGAIALLSAEMISEAEKLNFEKACLLRNFTEDLKKVILNAKTTNSLIQLKNLLIKCRNKDNNNSFELFHIQGGRIVNTYYIDDKIIRNSEYINELTEDIIQSSFNGLLFENYSGRETKKFTREDTDALKIITNWIYRNYSPADIYKITHQSDSVDIRKFILN